MNHSMTRNEKVEARVTSSHCGFPPPGAKRQKRGVSLLMVVMVLYLGWGLAAGPVHGADPQTFAGSILSATTDDPADKEQNKVAGPGWFWNLGPTGIRAMLVDASGKCEWEGKATCFLVKYVFPQSPADGKILPGDTIIGVNAKKFSTVYKLGYWFGIGYDGPPMEFGQAIEESESVKQGKLDMGKLDIMIVRKGKPLTVAVQIESKGAFSATFPFNCKKSEQLLKEACDYLVKAQDNQGGWWGDGDVNVDACLALLAQGPEYYRIVERHLDHSLAGIDKDTWNWILAMNAIVTSEYQLLTHNNRYRKYMLRLDDLFKDNQCPNFTFGHMGYPVRDKGFYGPMCGCTALCCLGWSMLERAGIPIHKELLDKTMVEMDMAFKEDGYPYGWSNEACQKTSVFSEEKVRNALTSLKKPIHARSEQAGGCLPMGAMTLVHQFRPWKDYSADLVTNHAIALARAGGAIVNGHGSGYLHGCFGLLAAASVGDGVGQDDPFRIVMDYYKPYINLARCCDGSFYTQPTRDDMNGDYGRSTRNLPTAVWAIVLSVPKRALLVQGRKDYKGKMDTAYRAILKRDFAAAARALAKPRPEEAETAKAMMDFIDAQWQKDTAGLAAIEGSGDILGLSEELAKLQKTYKGIEGFDKAVNRHEEDLQKDPWRKEVATGKAYMSFLGVLQEFKSASAAKKLDQFSQENAASIYGKWAAAIVKEFNASGTVTVWPNGKPFDLSGK